MKRYGRSAVSEFLEDRVVYRNLTPVDPRLPTLSGLRESLGLAAGITPRKSTPGYAKVIAEILKAARKIGSPKTQIERVLFIGDTLLNDSTAFRNICRAGNWPGLAFIGSENQEPPVSKIEEVEGVAVVHANRWAALDEFEGHLSRKRFRVDEGTAVLLDLDKTTLGARGRNDQVINQARVEAAFATVDGLLGADFDPQGFEKAYHHLNQTVYHPFTTDNQDYLVYMGLMISAGLYDLEELSNDIHSGQLANFEQFIQRVDGRAGLMRAGLKEVHQDVSTRVRQGDPTPFKAFRVQEYRATVAHMGQMAAETPMDQLLAEEIVLTQEVRKWALAWQAEGALLLGLSDKPDEASIPSPSLAAQGYQPIHKIETSIVGT